MHEGAVDRCLFRSCEGGVVGGLACKDGPEVRRRIARCGGDTEWRCGEQGVHILCHHHPLPSVLDTLWTWEALQRVLEASAQFSNAFEIRARFQGRDIHSDKGVHLIVCDGGIYFYCWLRFCSLVDGVRRRNRGSKYAWSSR